jgi:hypothetical protein
MILEEAGRGRIRDDDPTEFERVGFTGFSTARCASIALAEVDAMGAFSL